MAGISPLGTAATAFQLCYTEIDPAKGIGTRLKKLFDR
jgi:hypothetical protein